MNKLLILYLLLTVSFTASSKVAKLSNYDLTASSFTEFAVGKSNVFFVNEKSNLCFMTQGTWQGGLVKLENGKTVKAASKAGLLWDKGKLFFIDENQYISILIKSPKGHWILVTTVEKAHSKSKFGSNDKLLFYVAEGLKIKALNKNTFTTVLLTSQMPKARATTDLLWVENRLFYVSTSRKIEYLSNDSVWYVSNSIGTKTDKLSNLTNSKNNLYYTNKNKQICSISFKNWKCDIISNKESKVISGSDLKWIDNKLFFKSRGTKGKTSISYLVWNRINAWESCEFIKKFQADFKKKRKGKMRFPQTEINRLSNFIEVNNQEVLFVENEFQKVYKFRAPVKLESINNSIDKKGWELIPLLSDEFNNQSLEKSKWSKDYGWGNHPMQTNQNNERYSLYYNETNDSLHQFTDSTLNIISQHGPFSKTLGSNKNDINNAKNGGQYEYRSAMARSRPVNDIKYGYFEIRCKVPNTQMEKFCFWMYSKGQELDVFEIRGTGNCMPTNYHYFLNENRTSHNNSEDENIKGEKLNTDAYDIYCLKNQHLFDDFYTYAMKWDEEKIVWYLNNQVVRVVYKNQEYPKLNWAENPIGVRITTRIWKSYLSAPHNFPNTWEIDYVRVYQKKSH